MNPRNLRAALVAGALLGSVAGCSSGHASTSAAPNGFGSGAAVMVRAQLLPSTTGTEGSSLSQSLIAKPGVVFSNYTPADGLTVGLGKSADAGSIEQFLRAQPAVTKVWETAPPTAP